MELILKFIFSLQIWRERMKSVIQLGFELKPLEPGPTAFSAH